MFVGVPSKLENGLLEGGKAITFMLYRNLYGTYAISIQFIKK